MAGIVTEASRLRGSQQHEITIPRQCWGESDDYQGPDEDGNVPSGGESGRQSHRADGKAPRADPLNDLLQILF